MNDKLRPGSVRESRGWIWDIKRYALHDGPGVRTTVFFMGCPLRCLWCCNPESQPLIGQLCWIENNCLNCDLCLQICPIKAISRDEQGARKIDRIRCDRCGLCVEQCPGGALSLLGRQATVEEILQEVCKDAVFFQRSQGGLTLSGGEPTVQLDFAGELLRRYKLEEYGHTAMETCGYIQWAELAPLLDFIDLVLYDIKHMDSVRHRRLTGVDNDLILRNAACIAETGKKLIVRFPLIPGYNDDSENIIRTGQFVGDLPGLKQIDLLPYHRLGETKYKRLDQEYALQGTIPPAREQIENARQILESLGIRVRVGG